MEVLPKTASGKVQKFKLRQQLAAVIDLIPSIIHMIEVRQLTKRYEGRVAVTGVDADRFRFKVPTIRNVELTYPYFHDGAADTLPEAVDVMGRVQLGRSYTPEENAKFAQSVGADYPILSDPGGAEAVMPADLFAQRAGDQRTGIVAHRPAFGPPGSSLRT